MLQDGHSITQALNFHQVMGSHKDRTAFPAGYALDQLIYMVSRNWIKSGMGFV
jgi:hypothetical protein